MKIIYVLFFSLVGILFLGCEEEEPAQKVLLPSELSVKVQEHEEDPARITLTISSKNTNYYLVSFGDEEGGEPLNTKEKVIDHTYSGSGTYTIKVQAHASSTDYVVETTDVVIDLGNEGGGEAGIPTTGYTSPETYEGMALVWQDEFEGEELNTEDWTFEIGTGSGGWGNAELQYYRKENTRVEDGYLIITAKKESFQGQEYTSSRIKTQGKQSFQYGRIDIRAALPQGQGIWPALWMLGSNFSKVGWPACGEIDIMEMIGGGVGRDDRVHGTIHWDNAGNYANYGGHEDLDEGIFADEFHVFSIVWNSTSITWFLDGEPFYVVDITPAELSEFHQEFFFIFNVAVGGRWPGSPNAQTQFPQQMVVDYVRVFQAE